MTRTITGTIKVQISKYTTLEQLQSDDDAAVFDRLNLTDCDMTEYGHSVVGSATVTVTLNDPTTIISDKVESLRAEAKKVKADAHAAVIRIERNINELLAITNEVKA